MHTYHGHELRIHSHNLFIHDLLIPSHLIFIYSHNLIILSHTVIKCCHNLPIHTLKQTSNLNNQLLIFGHDIQFFFHMSCVGAPRRTTESSKEVSQTFTAERSRLLFICDNVFDHFLHFAVFAQSFHIAFPLICIAT